MSDEYALLTIGPNSPIQLQGVGFERTIRTTPIGHSGCGIGQRVLVHSPIYLYVMT
jgi:hypothetical protein